MVIFSPGLMVFLVQAAAAKVVRTHSLDAHRIHSALVVRNVDPDPGVRVRPIEFLHDAGKRRLFVESNGTVE
jgi:hypothetical protein